MDISVFKFVKRKRSSDTIEAAPRIVATISLCLKRPDIACTRDITIKAAPAGSAGKNNMLMIDFKIII